MGFTQLIAIIATLIITGISLKTVAPSMIDSIKSSTVDTKVITTEKAIFEAICRYITLVGANPTSMSDLDTAGFFPAVSNTNGFGGNYSFIVDPTKGTVTISTNIADATARSSYINSYKNTYKPVQGSGNTVSTMFVLPMSIMNGSGSFMAGIPVQPTAPATTSKYWYDTSGANTVLKMYDSASATWKVVSGGAGTSSSSSSIVAASSLSTTAGTNGQTVAAYDSTSNTIQTYTYYNGSWYAGSIGVAPVGQWAKYFSPWKQQYLFNTAQSGDITGWGVGTNLPGGLGLSSSLVTNSRVYLLGGNNGSVVNTVYTAPINSDGTLGAWAMGTNIPGALYNSPIVTTGSMCYLVGGFDGSSYAPTVYQAPINSDGTLGVWATGTSLPGTLYGTQAVVTNSRVYLLGGYNGSAYCATVYTAQINPDGTLGAWTTGTSLPGAVGYSQAIVTNARVYLLGGYNSGSISTVYTAPINSDGTLGAWASAASLPAGVYGATSVVTSSRVYLFGGNNGSTSNTVYSAPINADGTLGTWTAGTSLPGALQYSQSIVTSSKVYLLGGYNGSTYTSTVYYAPFSGGKNVYP